MAEWFSLLVSLLFALIVVGIVYWAVVVKLLPAVGVALPPIVVAAIQVLFALVVVYILYVFGVPLIKAITP